MKEEKEFKISYLAGHATTIISVTLVLLMAGIIASISIGARRETRKIKESVEISVIMQDAVTDAEAASSLKAMEKLPFVRQPRLITRREAMNEWISETGENLEEIFGVNPLSPEIEFSIPEQYANPDSIRMIIERVGSVAGVAEVAPPDADMVDSMNQNIETMSIVLGIIGLVMLVISFILINNTVRLTIYSRRFTIHTMQLVGATGGFISRPIVLSNLLAGLISGLLASSVIAVALAATPQYAGIEFGDFISWEDYAWIAIGLVAGGALICALASWMATKRYMHREYTELFR